MYALLPAMDGANGQLIDRAIDEMIQYYRNDERTFAREIRWLGIVLRRAEIVPLEEKRMIEERLAMFDDLMEKDPKMILTFVQMRFPALLDQARKKVKRATTAVDLRVLFQQLMDAADEDAARSLLS